VLVPPALQCSSAGSLEKERHLSQKVFEVLFWILAGLVAYVYLAYYFLLFVLARLFPTTSLSENGFLPSVSLLISVYNERQVIRQKLENALALDYPQNSLEILVVSDCSEDGSDEIVSEFAPLGVQLVRQAQRLGKSAGLNLGVSRAAGEILIFSDANAIYQPDAARQLVRHFADPRVGYVVGNARYVERYGAEPSAESEGLYWKLETWLKEKESGFGSVVGGDGAIYAIRREFFTPLLPTDINDFLNPLQIIARGYRGVYEPRAVCYEEAGDSFEKEFGRKVRIISRAFNALRRAPAVLLPWTQPRHWLALLSHKLLRWFAPLFLILLLLTNLFLLHSALYRVTLLLQFLFYVLAAAGWIIQKRKKVPKILYLPYYFCLVNLASLFGVVKSFRGTLSPTWQTIRQEAPATPKPTVHLPRRES
jgi:cellulose synthase/poly-beta-1,6-N-acetylglucosamine synthase-like glycosyltransferase